MAAGRKTGGRRPGSPNATTAATRERIMQMGDPVGFMVSVMEGKPAASAPGDDGAPGPLVWPDMNQRLHAARWLGDRLAPPAKSAPVNIDMPPVETADDVLRAVGSIVAAVARGELLPDVAETMCGLLDLHRKSIESSEFEKRLAALEAAASGKGAT